LLSRPLSIAISLIDKLEGERIEENIVYPAGDLALDINNLTLRLLNPYIFSLPKAKIYVNDELIADFTNLQQSLSVKVGDKVTIDNSSYSLNLIFKVTTTGNIKVSNHTVNVNKGQKITIDVEKPN
jgi:sporulation-control protein spo0M